MELLRPFCVKPSVHKILLACWLFGVVCLPASSLSAAQEHGTASQPAVAEQRHEVEGHGESPLSSLWKWLNFAVLFGGLGWYLRKPLGDFLKARAKGIEDGLVNAQEAKRTALLKSTEIQSRLAQLDKEIQQIKELAARDAEQERARILESARQEAQKILELASREIEGLKKSARLELKAYVAELAVKLAEERLRTSIGQEEDRRIIEKVIKSLDSLPN